MYACSALKRVYRDILRDGDKDVTFVYLKGTPELLHERSVKPTTDLANGSHDVYSTETNATGTSSESAHTPPFKVDTTTRQPPS